MSHYVQDIKRTTWGPGFETPRSTILRRAELEAKQPNMTQEDFMQYCRTLTTGMIQDNVEVVTDIADGWAYLVFDPTTMFYIHITLRVFDLELSY